MYPFPEQATVLSQITKIKTQYQQLELFWYFADEQQM
jgi:hypothetical protein